jgi:mono/diheme cytochrome c family protein
MPKLITALLLAGLISAASFGNAQQATPKIKDVPLQPTSPVSGEQMFATYCASCHGVKGTGNGPAAPAMKVQPADLTALSQKNGGTFPVYHIQTVLQFGVENSAHGSGDMPVWGDAFRMLHGPGSDSTMQIHQRIINLTRYLQQIQKK